MYIHTLIILWFFNFLKRRYFTPFLENIENVYSLDHLCINLNLIQKIKRMRILECTTYFSERMIQNISFLINFSSMSLARIDID